ncbi:MAG: hypothetical protein M1818_008243 [Claussenomyces sp. TS43310]|nr:MAG: hypothetical protein M1818_008243 [Claussenomyces sp. TS43310]
MAVLDSIPGIKVCIRVAGEELREYEPKHDRVEGPLAEKTVIKYIEAVSDAEFDIKISVDKSYKMNCHHITFDIYIDGKAVRSPTCKASRLHRHHWSRITEGLEELGSTGGNFLKKFRFASIKLVDPTETGVDPTLLSDVGTIKVEVFRKKKGHVIPRKARQDSFEKGTAGLCEKDLKGKALSHSTILGPSIRYTPSGPRTRSGYVDGPDQPIAVFIFRYRSKDALQQELIIPRSPSPQPARAVARASSNATTPAIDSPARLVTPTFITYDDLTPEAKDRLARQAFALQQPYSAKSPSNVRKKPEVEVSPRVKPKAESSQRVKREMDGGANNNSNRQSKRARASAYGSTVIDLTDD